jgi:hypothetical protein
MKCNVQCANMRLQPVCALSSAYRQALGKKSSRYYLEGISKSKYQVFKHAKMVGYSFNPLLEEDLDTGNRVYEYITRD